MWLHLCNKTLASLSGCIIMCGAQVAISSPQAAEEADPAKVLTLALSGSPLSGC